MSREEQSTAARRRRGRPLRLAYDDGPMQGLTVDSTARLAWLLTSLRLSHDDPALAERSTFARALSSIAVNADPTRLSRWESGSQPIPDRVLHGYETILGLDPMVLTSFADRLRRSLDPTAAPGRLLVRDLPDEQPNFDEFFERIDRGEHSGADWAVLTELHIERDYYVPPKVREELVQRLIWDTIQARGADYIRHEAASAAVARHPRNWKAILQTVGAIVTAPGAQFVEPAVMLLVEIKEPQINELLVKMLRGNSEPVARAAARALSTRLYRGDVDEAAMAQLAGAVLGKLSSPVEPALPSHCLDILAAMPAPWQSTILSGLRDRPRAESIRTIIDTGILIPAARARQTALRIGRQIDGSEAGRFLHETDPMLIRLLEEALFHVHRERRHYAALLLHASPFRDQLAGAIVRSAPSADTVTVSRMLRLLLYLQAREEVAGPVLNWALGHASPRLRRRALTTMISLDPPIGAGQHAQILLTARTDEDLGVRLAAASLLGAIDSPLLSELLDSADELQRQVASWWRTADRPAAERVRSGGELP